jgi:hypothetical protein
MQRRGLLPEKDLCLEKRHHRMAQLKLMPNPHVQNLQSMVNPQLRVLGSKLAPLKSDGR